jgi:hypothetical protein
MVWSGLLAVLIGVWLIAVPGLLEYASAAATSNDVIVGTAVLVLTIASLSVRRTQLVPAWATSTFVLGLWLVSAPWILGYAPYATAPLINDTLTGMLTMACAVARVHASRPTVAV